MATLAKPNVDTILLSHLSLNGKKKKKVLSFVSVFQMLGTERETCGPGLGLPEHAWEEASPPGLQEGEGITAPPESRGPPESTSSHPPSTPTQWPHPDTNRLCPFKVPVQLGLGA